VFRTYWQQAMSIEEVTPLEIGESVGLDRGRFEAALINPTYKLSGITDQIGARLGG
jgi:hypothetical protein